MVVIEREILTQDKLIQEAIKVEHCPKFSVDEPWMVIFQNVTQGESFHFATKEEANQLADSAKKMIKWVIEEMSKNVNHQ